MIFDGAPRRIILEASDGNDITMTEIYSRWKEWVYSFAGAPYPEAFVNVGNQELESGIYAGTYYFLNRTDGWLIRPREASHQLKIRGNLYPDIVGEDLTAPTLGAFNVTVTFARSNNSETVATGSSVLTPLQEAQLANASSNTDTLLGGL
jgi:hypothetical protein